MLNRTVAHVIKNSARQKARNGTVDKDKAESSVVPVKQGGECVLQTLTHADSASHSWREHGVHSSWH